MDLHGKCIILTGATGGIGSALCAGLVEAGATVVAVGRTEETLRRQAPGGSACAWARRPGGRRSGQRVRSCGVAGTCA